ncbi:MAG TPA: SRPBCC family protein [Polyangiaceae bacterium]|nr:SRPBCC family protein [Polyangiaceae bacterium]
MAPRRVARLIGVRADERRRKAMRAIGTREIASGVGMLLRPRPAGWAWMRVAGDLMDLALLGRALTSARKIDRARVAAATAAVAGVTLVDALTARRLSSRRASGGIEVKRSITVNCTPDVAYRVWHDLENLPRFMAHLESVRVQGERSRWRARAPAGTTVEWEAVLVDDRLNELVSWRSIEGSRVSTAGAVRFAPASGGRGTEVHVDMWYRSPAGALGAAIAKLFGEEPGQQVAGDLRRFKQFVETGEVLHSDASIHRGPHAARPPERFEQETGR